MQLRRWCREKYKVTHILKEINKTYDIVVKIRFGSMGGPRLFITDCI